MKKYITYIKYALIVVLFIFIIMDVFSDTTSNTDIDVMISKVAKAAEKDPDNLAEGRMIKRFYGLNPNDYEGTALFAPNDNMDVNEIFIVKLKNESQAADVKAAVQKRLETQLKSFEGYGAEQVALLKAHVLEVRGNYIFYMVGEKAADAQKVFLESL